MSQGSGTLRFDEFLYDSVTGELRRRGQAVHLEHQPSRVLARLVASAGPLVTREELAAELRGLAPATNPGTGTM